MGWRKVKEIRLVLVIFSNFGNWIYAVFHINFSFGLGPEPQSYLLRNDKREFQAQQNVFFLSTQHPFFWHYSYVLFTTEIFYLIEMVWVSTQQRTNDHISPLTMRANPMTVIYKDGTTRLGLLGATKWRVRRSQKKAEIKS